MDLCDLTKLSANVQFNNGKYVVLQYLPLLPSGMKFNNKGHVILDSLSELPKGTQFNSNSEIKLKNNGKMEVWISKENIEIGCKIKTIPEWKEFFKNKEFLKETDTNGKAYNLIEADFENAVQNRKNIIFKD